MESDDDLLPEIQISPCPRCGEHYRCPTVHLRTVMQLGKTPIEKHVATIMELESVSNVDAAAWLRHNMYAACHRQEVHCPKCDGKLTTWRAKCCSHCKYDWH